MVAAAAAGAALARTVSPGSIFRRDSFGQRGGAEDQGPEPEPGPGPGPGPAGA